MFSAKLDSDDELLPLPGRNASEVSFALAPTRERSLDSDPSPYALEDDSDDLEDSDDDFLEESDNDNTDDIDEGEEAKEDTSPSLPIATAPVAAPASAAPSKKKAASSGGITGVEEIGYRFPYGRAAIEPVPDQTGTFGLIGTFGVRLVWHRGKAVLPLFESTPLRSMAQVTLKGQKFLVFLSQHSRKKRDRIVLGGKRKTDKSPRSALRFLAIVEGREDRLSWTWRVAATAAALAGGSTTDETLPEDEVSIFLPFAAGKARIITQPGISGVAALWMNDLVATVAVADASGVKPGFVPEPVFTHDERGFQLTLRGADLSGSGVTLRWETWISPARTEAEARSALLRHAGDIADRRQVPPCAAETAGGAFLRLIEENQTFLMDDKRIDKRGIEKQVYRAATNTPNLHVAGETADAALTACALLARFYMTGDDALRRRARLISRGVCDFQINTEESAHWGAVWDAIKSKKQFTDIHGEATVSVAATARASKGLHICFTHFGTEVLSRTALAAAQWLLLKMDRFGFIVAERFTEEGPPTENQTHSPWIMGEALIPLVETFRINDNEIFLKSALRVIRALKEGIAESTLPFETASSEHLASCIEGVLLVSREYESEEMIALAKRIMLGLRARRLPNGTLVEPPGITTTSSLAPMLAGARAALALARVDEDPLYPLFAMRAIRTAARLAREMTEAGEVVNIADRTALLMHSIGLLLTVAQRAPGAMADRDLIQVKRGWQTFQADPATREYIQVTGRDGTPVDYIALVCPVSLQVLIAVLAPADMEEVKIVKTGRTPFVKNLLNGDFDLTARLVPLGDGREASIGVFIADT